MKTYSIRDNGNTPFIANIYPERKHIDVYAKDTLVYNTDYEGIFIGSSSLCMTTFLTGYFGKKYDGNTLLVNVGKNQYTYIGGSIFSFTSKASICTYESPIGNNEYAYPYAVDELQNYYLINEDVIMHTSDETHNDIKQGMSPYSYYYENRKFPTKEMIIIPVDKSKKVRTHPIKYISTPYQEYYCFVQEDILYIRDRETNEKKQYSEDTYAEYIKQLGLEHGFSALQHDEDYAHRGYTGVIIRK